MKLPNGDLAVVDIAKLRDYCLCAHHPRGRHKARVFAAAVGLTSDQSDRLAEALLAAAQTHEALPTHRDGFGQRYALDFVLSGPKGRATVRSNWIVRSDEDFPRLTSCHIL